MTKDIEFEGKILDISPEKVRQSLDSLGAKKIGKYNFRRYVFDTIPNTPNKWVRLRTNGINTTLAVKEISSEEIDGTSEWEIEVSDISIKLF